ncbi:MAG TPA: DUF222 domain-containing protein [Kribbellaceae bacterium]
MSEISGAAPDPDPVAALRRRLGHGDAHGGERGRAAGCGGRAVRDASGRLVPRPGSMWDRGWRPPSGAEVDEFIARARRLAGARRRHGVLDLDEPDPGAELLERLEAQDTGELTDAGWLDRLESIERVTGRLAALRAEAVARFDDATRGVCADLGHELPGPGDRTAAAGERRWHGGLLRSVGDEVGLALNLHRGAANARVVRSWELVHNYPATRAALAAGELTERAAFTIVDELGTLVDETQVRDAEAALVEWARTHPQQRIRQQARREIARRDAAATDRVRRRELDQRAIRMVTQADTGTAELISTHDAVDAAAVMTCLTGAATPGPSTSCAPTSPSPACSAAPAPQPAAETRSVPRRATRTRHAPVS